MRIAACSLVLALAGCEQIAGLDDFVDAPGPGGAGAGGSAGGAGGSAGGGGGIAGSPPAALHSMAFGSTGVETVDGAGTDNNGDVFVAGTHVDAITIEQSHPGAAPGARHPYVASFNGQLAPRWSRAFETSGTPNVRDLACDGAGNVVVGGSVGTPIDFGGGQLMPNQIDAFFARFSDTGAHQGSNVWGAQGQQLTFGVAKLVDGIVLAGSFQNTIDFFSTTITAVDTDGFIVKLTSNGEALRWLVHLTGPGEQLVAAVAGRGADPRVYTTGTFTDPFQVIAYDSAGAPVGNPTDVPITPDSISTFLMSFDAPTGEPGDILFWEDALPITPTSIAVDTSNDRVVVAGSFEGTLKLNRDIEHVSRGDKDAFVVALDLALKLDWSRHYGAENGQVAWDVAVDSLGHVVVGGETGFDIDFGNDTQTADGKDAFVVKLDDRGRHLWSGLFGGPNDDSAEVVAIDGSRNVIVAGTFSDSIEFGDGMLHLSSGSDDVFVAKFPP